MTDFCDAQPTLSTPRLTLRPLEAADAPAIERLAGDRAVADTTLRIPHPYPNGAANAWIAGLSNIWESGEGATFALVERDSGSLTGVIGFAINELHGHAELGYWIGVPYWSRGYCTEAAQAVVALAFSLGVHRMQAHHLLRNPASGRVMQKLGMQKEGTLREATQKWGVFEDLAIYSILDREWAELHPDAQQTKAGATASAAESLSRTEKV